MTFKSRLPIEVAGRIVGGKAIGPFAIGSSPQNNYAPTGWGADVAEVVIAPTINMQMTGMDALPDGTRIKVINRSPNGASCSFVNQSTSSLAPNRYLMPDEVTANWVLAMDAEAEFQYDGAASRWKMASWNSTAIPKLTVALLGASQANIDLLYLEGSAHKMIIDELEIHGQGQGQVALYTMPAGDNHDFKFAGDPITGNKLSAWFWATLTAPSPCAITGVDSGVVGPYVASTLGRTGVFHVHKDSPNPVTFKHDIGSVAGNRLYMPNNTNYVVRPGCTIVIRRCDRDSYDGWQTQSVT